MTHQDHKRLIEKAVTTGGTWADVGSGEGAFTLALRDIAGPQVEIYSIDSNAYRLNLQRQNFAEKFPDTNIHYVQGDFTKELDVPELDGIIAANAIHFIKDTFLTLKHLRTFLKPVGRLIIVEYNVDSGNDWVPHPFSYQTFASTAKDAGFSRIELLETVPSEFLKQIYSAVAYV